MIFRLRIAFAVMWLCCASAVSAQVGFSIPFVNNAVPGTDKNMTVNVTNFDSIVSMQYVIRWNPTVLKYVTINTFGALPGLDILDFNVQHAIDSGYVRLVWEGPNTFPGISLADGTTLFRLRFTIIGNDTSSSPIKFTEITYSFPTTEFEIVKAQAGGSLIDLQEDECDLTHGFVAVGYTVSATEPTENDPFGISISPNPSAENTRVSFQLAQTSDVQVLVADATGRTLYTEDMPQLPAGNNSMVLHQNLFPEKGTYFITLRSGSEMTVRPLIRY
jgi:hypothetical protein